MKNKILTIFVLSILLLTSPSAFSYFFCSPNWYLAGSASYVWHNNHHFPKIEDHRHLHHLQSLSTKRTYKWGGGANISLGYIYENLYKACDLRVEGEIVYKRNALNHVRNHKLAVGRTQDIALMLNFITDIPLWYCFDLNIGSGFGITFNELKLASIEGIPVFPHIKHRRYAAGQFLSGLTWNIFPDVALTFGYRLFATQKIRNTKGERCKSFPITQSLDFGMRFRL